mgnify:CR=1 FL=1
MEKRRKIKRKKLQIFFCLCAFTREDEMPLIKVAYLMLNFLNLKSFPLILFFVVASSLSTLCVQMLCGLSPISIHPWHNFSSDCACLNKNVWEPAKRVEWFMTAVKNVARSNASLQFWYAFLLSTLGLVKIMI